MNTHSCVLLDGADLCPHIVHNDESEPASEVRDFNKNEKIGNFM